MAKLRRESKGRYYFENRDHETVNIFQIERHLWGWSVGRSMTKGTFPSLGAAKEHFNL